jgi:hypothetical protein
MMVTVITGQIEYRKWYDLKKFGETKSIQHPAYDDGQWVL